MRTKSQFLQLAAAASWLVTWLGRARLDRARPGGSATTTATAGRRSDKYRKIAAIAIESRYPIETGTFPTQVAGRLKPTNHFALHQVRSRVYPAATPSREGLGYDCHFARPATRLRRSTPLRSPALRHCRLACKGGRGGQIKSLTGRRGRERQAERPNCQPSTRGAGAVRVPREFAIPKGSVTVHTAK